jgi:hypothetical protein
MRKKGSLVHVAPACVDPEKDPATLGLIYAFPGVLQEAISKWFASESCNKYISWEITY